MNNSRIHLETALADRIGTATVATELLGSPCGWIRRLWLLAALVLLLFSGCEMSGGNEVKKMDTVNDDRYVEDADTISNKQAPIPPIDSAAVIPFETATFALG